MRKIIRGVDACSEQSARLVQMVPGVEGGFIGYGVDVSGLGATDFRLIGGDYSARTLTVDADISLDLKEFLALDQISQGFSGAHIRRAMRISAAEFEDIGKRLCVKFECDMKWLPYRGTQKGALVLGLLERPWSNPA